MIRWLMWGVGGLAWSALTFFVGFYATFPSSTVASRIEYESVGATDKQFALSMGSVRPWPTGARATDVTLYGLKRGKRSKDNPDPGYDRSPILTADSLVLRARPIDWAMQKKSIGWGASLLGGSFSGDYAESQAAVDVAFDLDELDLSQLGLSNAERTINLTGLLSGEADLHFDVEDTKQSSGTFSLEATGFGLGDGSTVGGFNLPAAPFTKATIAAEIENGKISIKDGTFEGSIISATLSGDITINKKVMRSRQKLDLAFSLPEEFDQLAQLSPSLKRSKDEEGRYHCSVSGQMFAPSFRCGKTSAKKNTDTGDSSAGNAGGSYDPEMSDEERRAAREERIKERRERLKKRREEAAKARGEEGDVEAPAPEPRRPGDLEDPIDEPMDRMPPGVKDYMPPDDMVPPPDDMGPPPDEGWVPGEEPG